MLNRVCNICGEKHSIYLLTQGGLSLYQCLDCELIFRDAVSANAPEKDPADILLNAIGEFAARPLEVAESYRRIMDRVGLLEKHVAVFSNANRSLLADVFKSEKLKLEIFGLNDIEVLARLDAASFDVIILDQAIERCCKPEETLTQAHRVIKEGGKILIGFTAIENQPHGWLGAQSTWSPDILYYFSHTTMQLLLEKAGFRRIWNRSEITTASQIFLATKAEVHEKQSLSVIMPVYNERQTFELALDLVLKKELTGVGKREIVVVDNNSKDGTRDLVKSYANRPDIKVVFADEVQGKGYAVRQGIKHATGDIILIQDADLEYDVDDYDALLEPLINHKKVFVLGSRHKGKWKMRSFLNNQISAAILNSGQVFFTVLLNVLYGQQMTDPLTMYKVFRRECLYGLKFECNGFDYDQELVSKLIRKGYTPHEVRVNYRSRSFSEGKKISMLRDPIMCLICDLKYRFANPFQEGWKEGPGFSEQGD